MPCRPLFILLLLVHAAPLFADEAFERDIVPLIARRCADCHGGDDLQAGVDLTKFTDENAVLYDKKLWRRVLAQLEAKTMPPPENDLPDAERAMLVAWTKGALAKPIPLLHLDPGKSVIRRLTRTEYNNTLRDLLGIEGDSVGMGDEAAAQGFDNLAAALKVQAALMEKYFAGADKALELAFTPIKDDAAREAKRKAAYDKLFFIQPGGEVTKRQAARQIMHRFLARAFRRPIEGAEVERYFKLYEAAGGSQQPLEVTVRAMLKGALVSPNFLLRIEENRLDKNISDLASRDPYKISDYELATRLSYFLWSSMPDERLFEFAAGKKLSDPEILSAEVDRMLADPKARALADNFAAQWLQLRKLPAARPSTEFFPTLTPALRQAMAEETLLLFDSLRTENRSLVTLLDANYTFLNAPLAEHYGIAGVSGNEFRRVELKSGDVRGGVLSMASILTINAHTFRTSPTMRGKWILEVVLGAPPPPPPANASQLKENEPGKEPKDFREVLAQHAKDATCAACHKKIDPLGFGLENFDAIGRYREMHGNDRVDASGVLPGGQKFSGPKELKKIILVRQDEYLRNLTEQMFIYALGREIEYHDQPQLEAIYNAMAKDDFRLRALVRGIAMSYAFGNRKNETVK